MDRSALDIIWDRVTNVTSQGLQVTQLELLYDTIKGCIYIYPTDYAKLIQVCGILCNKFDLTYFFLYNYRPLKIY